MLMQKHRAQAGERGGQRGEREKKFLNCFVLPQNVNFYFTIFPADHQSFDRKHYVIKYLAH